MAEKSISQIPRPVREQYQKGMTAFDRKNYDYAIAIFNQVLAQEPAFFDCRQALRVSQHAKSGGGSTFFKKMLSGAGSSPLLAKAQMQKDPLEAIKTAEQILNSDANSVAAHKLLAESAMSADLPKTAVLSLEIAVKCAPKDEDVQKSLARAYSAAGQGEKAEMVMAELIRLHPGDLQLANELKDISAHKTLAEGGYEALSGGTGSYRDILKNKEQATALEQESRQVKSEDVAQRQITKLEAELVQQPNDMKKLRTVAELYVQQKKYDKALETYQRIVDKEGAADSSLQKAMAEATIKKFDAAIATLDPQAPDFAEKSAQAKAERDNYTLAEIKERADRYPGDLGIRFELGELLFKMGKVGEAMPEFQKAQANPHKRIQALSYMGQCLAAKGFNDMAARTLQNAIKEKPVFDDEKKEMIYALAAVFEKMGKQSEADDLYKQIYEIDMSFKDVMAKVEASYNRPPPGWTGIWMNYSPADNRYDKAALYRRCGRWGLKLPAVSLGLWHNFGGVDAFETGRAMVHRAFDLGITHFDLANNYGPPPGSAEETFGRILKRDLSRHRDELVISSKAGYLMWPGPYGEWGTRKYLLASLDQSLRRLGLEYVDIFYSHRFDPDTPLEETMGAVAHAVRAGKALYAGLSNYKPEETRRAATLLREMGAPCLIHQARYSMFDRWVEESLLEVLSQEGMGCIAFSPLAQGLLSEKYLHGIPEGSRASKPHGFLRPGHVTPEKVAKVSRLHALASARGQTLAQLALGWVLRQPQMTSVLIGASSVAQIEENVKTLEKLSLSQDELRAIEAILK